MANVPTTTDETGRTVAAKPIRMVAGLTATNEAGQTVDVLPVRTVVGGTATDASGKTIATLPVAVVATTTTTDEIGRAIGVNPAREVAGLTATDAAGQIVDVVPVRAIGTPTPTPTPAPAFTVQPSIAPGSGTAGATTFTATPGTVSNGTITSRAWLLSGVSISTGTTATPSSAGTLTYQEFATGAGGSASSSIQSVTVAAAPTSPPADWRMPATVTTTSGISAAQTALAAAQTSALSKTRPSFTVASGTEKVSYAIAASTTPVLLSWVGAPYNGSAIDIDGVGQTFTQQFPQGSGADLPGDYAGTGTTKPGRRQFFLVPPSASARVIGLSITGAATVYPLLHQLPASGPWDAHVSLGASREDQGMPSRYMEDAIIALFPTRDPVVFAWGKSSANADDIAAYATQIASIYAGVAKFATVGAVITNSWSLPYTSGQGATLGPKQAAIRNTLSAAGISPGVGTISYRSTNSTTPAAQDNGSKPYNDNIVIPDVAANLTAQYDGTFLRPRIDEYLLTLFYRGLLSDDRHGSSGQYDQVSAYWADQWYRFIYTGAWGVSMIEQIVAAAEAGATTKATALTKYNEAAYARDALAASSGKTSVSARLAAIYPTVMFYEAVRVIDAAVAAPSTPSKAAAQAALDAAVTAGYSGGTAPNTVTAQQARIDAIVLVTYTKIAQVGLGSTTAVTGWNRTNSTTAVASGVIADLLTQAGASTGWALNVTNAGTMSTNNANSAQVSAMAEFPSAILTGAAPDSSNQLEVTVSGLDNAKTYDVLATSTRTGVASRNGKLTLNGVNLGEFDVANNVTNQWTASNVAPVGGVITFNFARGTGASTCYGTALIVKERA